MGKTKDEDVKKILKVWGNCEELCKEKNNRIEDLKQLCSESKEIKAVQFSNIPKSKNQNLQNSFIENSVIKNIDIYEKAIKRLKEEIEEILNKTALVDYWLSFLPREEAEIIVLRYKNGLSWDYIPDIIHKSRIQCFRIHNRVIKKFNVKTE